MNISRLAHGDRLTVIFRTDWVVLCTVDTVVGDYATLRDAKGQPLWSYVRSDDEGISWGLGHHGPESPEMNALLAAYALENT